MANSFKPLMGIIGISSAALAAEVLWIFSQAVSPNNNPASSLQKPSSLINKNGENHGEKNNDPEKDNFLNDIAGRVIRNEKRRTKNSHSHKQSSNSDEDKLNSDAGSEILSENEIIPPGNIVNEKEEEEKYEQDQNRATNLLNSSRPKAKQQRNNLIEEEEEEEEDANY